MYNPGLLQEIPAITALLPEAGGDGEQETAHYAISRRLLPIDQQPAFQQMPDQSA
jgi:hypothetical protein